MECVMSKILNTIKKWYCMVKLQCNIISYYNQAEYLNNYYTFECSSFFRGSIRAKRNRLWYKDATIKHEAEETRIKLVISHIPDRYRNPEMRYFPHTED